MPRIREITSVVLPSALLALMPKCPMCLAAYVAIGTGFTMSCSSAHLLMRVLTLLCIGTLAFFLAKRIIRHLRYTPSSTFKSQTPTHEIRTH